MKPIKVYLQYPWKFPDSPYYRSLVENPPEGIKYLNAEKQKGVITRKGFFWTSNFLKRNIRRTLNISKMTIPNAHLSPEGEYDLIHCAHCLSKNNKPWVADFEGVWQLYVGEKTKRAKKKVLEILQRDNCKKILSWTEKTKADIIKEFPEIENKVEVLYPGVPLQGSILEKKKDKKIKILYATRYFWIKGGLIALETLKRIKERYEEVEIIFISNTPEKVKEKYKDIEIKNLVPQDKLYKYYSKADIFFYPSLVDTFGFGILEAMSFGLPIVTVNTKSTATRNELIENEKTGLMFDVNERLDYYHIGEKENQIVDKLVETLSRLIENKKLRENISMNCIQIIKKGKFSLENRNKKLKEIYRKAQNE